VGLPGTVIVLGLKDAEQVGVGVEQTQFVCAFDSQEGLMHFLVAESQLKPLLQFSVTQLSPHCAGWSTGGG